MAQGYDIIGDVHGCADELEELLGDLGYTAVPSSGVYRHPDRKAIFVGDLIDRGPCQLRVLEVVKAMVDAGSAQIVMGNHEFNALAYATEDPQSSGDFLRPHDKKNAGQHIAFLEQLSDEQKSLYLAWFFTFPLWIDFGDLRIVHACWHQTSIELIEERLGGNRFSSIEIFADAARTSDIPSSLYAAIETILKGPELNLVKYGAKKFRDKDGNLRQEARVRWWRSGGTTLRELAEIPQGSSDGDNQPYGELPDVFVDDIDQSYSYEGQVPVVYGHYWRTGVPVEHEDWTRSTACVDFSAVNGGTMVAYQWNGERTIDWRNYHPHGRNLIAHEPTSQ
jgi:hypothetical protein